MIKFGFEWICFMNQRMQIFLGFITSLVVAVDCSKACGVVKLSVDETSMAVVKLSVDETSIAVSLLHTICQSVQFAEMHHTILILHMHNLQITDLNLPLTITLTLNVTLTKQRSSFLKIALIDILHATSRPGARFTKKS